MKIADGGYRAAGPALIHVLEQVDVLAAGGTLGARRRSPRRPCSAAAGRSASLEPVFALRRTAELRRFATYHR